jgi:hypothetical protein
LSISNAGHESLDARWRGLDLEVQVRIELLAVAQRSADIVKSAARSLRWCNPTGHAYRAKIRHLQSARLQVITCHAATDHTDIQPLEPRIIGTLRAREAHLSEHLDYFEHLVDRAHRFLHLRQVASSPDHVDHQFE